jgi:hypothetical protein
LEGAGEGVCPCGWFLPPSGFQTTDDTIFCDVSPAAPFNAHFQSCTVPQGTASVHHLRNVHAPRRRRRCSARRRRGGGGGGACIAIPSRNRRTCAGARVVPRLAAQPAAARPAAHGGADALAVRRVGVAPRDAPRNRLLRPRKHSAQRTTHRHDTQQAFSAPHAAPRKRTHLQRASGSARRRALCSAPMTLPFSALPFSAALIFARCSGVIGRFFSPRRAASWRMRSALETSASSARMAVAGARWMQGARFSQPCVPAAAACTRRKRTRARHAARGTRLPAPAAAAKRPRLRPPSPRRRGRGTHPARCASSG